MVMIEQNQRIYGQIAKYGNQDQCATMETKIVIINLLGGLAVGVLQHGMPFTDAAATYTLLSIGDGLVAQLPALLVSSAVAMLVTRASRSQDMSEAMMGQVFGQYRALAIAAGIIGLVGLVPGMPNLAFLTLAAILGMKVTNAG